MKLQYYYEKIMREGIDGLSHNITTILNWVDISDTLKEIVNIYTNKETDRLQHQEQKKEYDCIIRTSFA